MPRLLGVDTMHPWAIGIPYEEFCSDWDFVSSSGSGCRLLSLCEVCGKQLSENILGILRFIFGLSGPTKRIKPECVGSSVTVYPPHSEITLRRGIQQGHGAFRPYSFASHLYLFLPIFVSLNVFCKMQ